MKAKNATIFSFFFILFFSACDSSNHNDFPPIEDRYFGQKLPGLIPELFTPQILSSDGYVEGVTFSPDIREFYFSKRYGKYNNKRSFFVVRFENGSWGEVSETDIRWPLFSSEGDAIYVGKEYRKRTDDGWSEPKPLGGFLEEQAHGLTVSANGTFYFPFFKKEDNGHGNLGYSRLVNGKHENPVKLSAEINTGEYIAHPYITPDESYLMWDVEREDGHGLADIYISFRHEDGYWLAPINMGSVVNTELQESSPYVSPDGKYLFFTRGAWETKEDGGRYFVGEKYWVDAQVIENLKPKQ